MIKKLLLLLILGVAVCGCVNGPAVMQTYTSGNTTGKQKKVLIYRMIIEGDNYDPYVQSIILDEINLLFKNTQSVINIDTDVFQNDLSKTEIGIDPAKIQEGTDYIAMIIIRIKNLGYSITSLSDENNIFIRSLLFDGKGKLLTSANYNKLTSYSISSSKLFYQDLTRAIEPLKKYILSVKGK